MLADRGDALTRRRVQTVDRLPRCMLAGLLPGQVQRDLTATQAEAMRSPAGLEERERCRDRLRRVLDWFSHRRRDQARPPGEFEINHWAALRPSTTTRHPSRPGLIPSNRASTKPRAIHIPCRGQRRPRVPVADRANGRIAYPKVPSGCGVN